MMEEEYQGEEETMDDKEPPDEPTEVDDCPVGSLSGRTLIEERNIEILRYECTKGSDLNETWVMSYLKEMSPSGLLTLRMTQKKGEYLGASRLEVCEGSDFRAWRDNLQVMPQV
jgi:hypothetical protein